MFQFELHTMLNQYHIIHTLTSLSTLPEILSRQAHSV